MLKLCSVKETFDVLGEKVLQNNGIGIMRLRMPMNNALCNFKMNSYFLMQKFYVLVVSVWHTKIQKKNYQTNFFDDHLNVFYGNVFHTFVALSFSKTRQVNYCY